MQEHPFITIAKQSESQNLPASISDLNDCLNLLIKINEIMKEKEVKLRPWQKYLEIQSVKFIFHTSSLLHLLGGTPLNPEKKLVFDIGSIFLLRRAQLENYLMFYYLNIQPQSDDEGQLKVMFFDLGGLVHRQWFPATTDETIEKKKNEEAEISYLLKEIQLNKYFQSLHIQKRNDLLKKMPPRILGWEQIILNSHLKTNETTQLWKYYSNYAHSEMIGIIQMEEYIKNPRELDATVYMTAEQTLVTTCILLEDFFASFSELEEIKTALPQMLKSKIDFWNRIGKK